MALGQKNQHPQMILPLCLPQSIFFLILGSRVEAIHLPCCAGPLEADILITEARECEESASVCVSISVNRHLFHPKHPFSPFAQ